jgi:hypothetical protein
MSRLRRPTGRTHPARTARRRGRGQALVEFALVAPLFFILIFGIIEAARFTFYYEILNHAAREGARYAIVHGGNAQFGCASGPQAPDAKTANCDVPGNNVIAAARDAALSLVSSGSLSGNLPIWCPTPDAPPPGGPCVGGFPGDNGRGKYVTVFLDYTYQPILPMLPSITISARSTLVINN